MAPSAPIEPSHRKLPSLNAGWSTTTCVAGWRGAAGPPAACVVAFSTSAAAFCIFCMLPVWLMRMRASAVENLVAASGNCSMIVCICPRSEYVPSTERTDHARHHDDRADNARDLDRFEPRDERIQRVGNDDAEQQRHDEGLRPRQSEHRRERRQDSQREAARIDRQPRCGKGDERRVDRGAGLLQCSAPGQR